MASPVKKTRKKPVKAPKKAGIVPITKVVLSPAQVRSMFVKAEKHQGKVCAFAWCKNPLGPAPVAEHYCSNTCLMFARQFRSQHNKKGNNGMYTYKPEYARERFFEYLRECEEQHKPLFVQEGKEVVPIKTTMVPSVEGYAHFIGATLRTMRRWAEYEEEFYDAMVRLREVQKMYLINNGLNGNYTPQIAKLLLMTNHGMAEKRETDNRNTNLVGIVRDVYALADQTQAKMTLDAPLGVDKDDEQDVI